MHGQLVQAQGLKNGMGLVEDGAAGRLIHAAALHAHETVLDDIEDADAVGAADLVELENDVLGAHLFAVEGNRDALVKLEFHIGGLVGCIQGRNAHFQEAGLLVLRLIACVFQVQTFMGQMPEVLVLGIVGLTVDLQRDVMGFGIVDLFISGFDGPFTPGSNDGHVRSEMLDSKFKADLIVALAGAAVADGVSAFLESDLNEPLGNAWTGRAGTQQVFFVDGAGFHGGDNKVIHIFIHEIQHIQLGSAGLQGFLFQSLEFVSLSDIAGDGDDFRIVVVFLEPGDDDGCIQSAGVGEYDFLVIGVHQEGPPQSVFWERCVFYIESAQMSIIIRKNLINMH